MKTPRLETKRRAVGRLAYRRLHARIAKRQRVAAAAAEHAGDLQGDVPHVGVARALLIILGLHVVAIAGIFVHNRYFDGETVANPASEAKAVAASPAESKIGPGDEPYVVQPSDTYDRIAGRHGVGVDDLRMANGNVPLRAGRILRIPPRRIVAVESAELARRRENTSGAADGTAQGAAVLVRPAVHPVSAPVESAGGGSETYVVRAGDSVWRIATRYGVSQEDLMKANGIDDPRKMGVGMELRIPSSQ